MTNPHDLRAATNKALKAFALLPSVVEMDADSVETVAALSGALRSVDDLVRGLGRAEAQPIDGRTTPQDESFPRAYVIKRDSEIASWLTELTELVSELLADDAQIHHDQIKYLHERLWKMRWHFGFAVEPTQDGES